MTLYDKLAALRRRPGGYDRERICAELEYLAELSGTKGGAWNAELEAAADRLLVRAADCGALTREGREEAEASLAHLSGEAKRLKIRAVGHAHIDMNWMWGFQETASVTADTFRTVLELMKEYPLFTFSQSQASVYRIMEEYCPEVLEEIGERVREGRWEVSASTWVETDKNMPSGESLARHILYTKRYFCGLFGLSPDDLQLDFEPDTFGHSIAVPDILKRGGVRYYYHCRGSEAPELYRWMGRGGESLLVYREPDWYLGPVEYSMIVGLPAFCARTGVDAKLEVYGVGDHGGGPTRRDLERLTDMMDWPLAPTLTFGSYHAYFREIEAFESRLPQVEGELNFVFTGCYTSQSRIKTANRIAEARLYEAEALCAAARVTGGGDRTAAFRKAWELALFNQFHDILPGSGVIDTREYAMANFQKLMATANCAASAAMRSIAAAIDTSGWALPVEPGSTSEGAGAGWQAGQTSAYCFPRAERGMGHRRLFCLFNTPGSDYDGLIQLSVWDWSGDPARALFRGADGCPLESESAFSEESWGHSCRGFLVKARIPAFGYTLVSLDEEPLTGMTMPEMGPRTDLFDDGDIVLDNGLVRAVFSRAGGRLISFADKASGRELASSASFRLITEDPVNGMTSWRVGPYMRDEGLNGGEAVRITAVKLSGLRQGFEMSLSFGERSSLRVKVSLDVGSRTLELESTVDFQETGSREKGIPQLAFRAETSYTPVGYRYDVPFGVLDRPAMGHDVPANSFAAALSADGPALMLVTDTKYGYRGDAGSLTVDLIRGSFDPDPYPEYGLHSVRIGLCAMEESVAGKLIAASAAFCHRPSYVSLRPSAGACPERGQLPAECSFIRAEGGVAMSAVKLAEEQNSHVFRLYDTTGKGGRYTLTFPGEPKSAMLCDLNEKPLRTLAPEGRTVSNVIEPYGIHTLSVRF